MSSADNIYDQGARLFRAGDFTAAEQAFRRLLDLVPHSDGKVYGRAAYSLALALIEQSRIEEAKAALRAAIDADPGLTRARDRLTELEQDSSAPPSGLPEPTTAGGFVGVARRVRIGAEPDPMFGQQRNPVLRFRVERLGGDVSSARTVELRGSRISGSVEDGDVVEIPGQWRSGGQPGYVLNLTTGERVQPGTSGARTAQWTILIIFLAAFAVFAAFVVSNML